jgi:hypothetical protein
MPRFICIICFSVMLFACGGPKVDPPKYPVIPPDTIVEILVKYHLTEGINTSPAFTRIYQNYKEVNLTDSMLAEFGYTHALFDSSIAYYSGDPRNYDEIYNKVVEELNMLDAHLQKEMLQLQHNADSLSRVADSIAILTTQRVKFRSDSFARAKAFIIRSRIKFRYL